MRLCPICGGANKKVILPGREFVKCKDCNFYFIDIKDNMNYSISNKYKKSTYLDRDRLRSVFCRTKNLILNSESIIDIGCGDGFLLDLILKYGHHNIHGVEFFGNTKYITKEIPDEQYELIFLNGVIEHIYNLNSFMGNICKHVNENTVIYIEIPDFGLDKLNRQPLYDFSNEHINLFSMNSLITYMELHGFFPQTVSRCEYLYDTCIYGIFNRIHYDIENSIINQYDNYLEYLKEIKNYLSKPIYLWGAGSFTRMVMNDIDCSNILGIIDSNMELHGKDIKGIKIIPPTNLIGNDILIMSEKHREQIISFIKKNRIKNNIIGV